MRTNLNRVAMLRTVIRAALAHQASQLYAEDHPESPHGDAEMELREDELDSAIADYVRHNEELLGRILRETVQ